MKSNKAFPFTLQTAHAVMNDAETLIGGAHAKAVRPETGHGSGTIGLGVVGSWFARGASARGATEAVVTHANVSAARASLCARKLAGQGWSALHFRRL